MHSDDGRHIRYKQAWVGVFFVSFCWVVFIHFWSFAGISWDFLLRLLVSALLSFIALIPLHGYVWSVDHGYKRVWRIVFWLYLPFFFTLTSCTVIATASYGDSFGGSTMSEIGFGTFTTLKEALWLFALWQYSKPKDETTESKNA